MMNGYFKRFVLCICCLCFLSMSLRPKYANANIGVADVFILGTTAISGSAMLGLVGAAMLFSGYEPQQHKADIENYIINKIGLTALKSYLYLSKDANNNNYVSINSQGLDAIQSEMNTLRDTPEPILVSTTDSTVNTVYGTPSPYMLNGYYMTPYLYNSVGYSYLTFSANYGDTVSFQMRTRTGAVSSCSYTPTSLCYFKAFQYNTLTLYISYSYDNVNWTAIGSCSSVASTYCDVGYKTTSQTVYVPSAGVVNGTGIEGTASSQIGSNAISIPISGQYQDNGDLVYVPIGTATPVGGLTAQTGIDAGAGQGTTTIDPATISEGVTDGVNASNIGDLTVPSPMPINFAPLLVAGSTLATKFPFCLPWDLYNSFNILNVEPIAPKWTITFPDVYFVGGGSIDIDFSIFEQWAVIVRWGILVLFVIALIVLTRKIIGGD